MSSGRSFQFLGYNMKEHSAIFLVIYFYQWGATGAAHFLIHCLLLVICCGCSARFVDVPLFR